MTSGPNSQSRSPPHTHHQTCSNLAHCTTHCTSTLPNTPSTNPHRPPNDQRRWSCNTGGSVPFVNIKYPCSVTPPLPPSLCLVMTPTIWKTTNSSPFVTYLLHHLPHALREPSYVPTPMPKSLYLDTYPSIPSVLVATLVEALPSFSQHPAQPKGWKYRLHALHLTHPLTPHSPSPHQHISPSWLLQPLFSITMCILAGLNITAHLAPLSKTPFHGW